VPDPLERFPRRTGVATLTARRQLTPSMLRLTISADEFGPDWPIEQPGEILTLLFPEDGQDVVLPLQGWVFPEGATEQHWRNYTVRRHDPDAREIDIDVVVHEPSGAACAGAQRIPVGGPVGYAGPRVDFHPRETADWLLLCGDETALPAIAAIVASRPPVPRVAAVIEVADPAEEQPLDGADVQWVHRGAAPAATTAHLAEALRALDLPPGDGQVWGAAESRIARDAREVLRDERDLPRKQVSVKGYWLRTGDWELED
jgi:NADPH-dependent ferric siderophore reductase